MSDMFKLYDMVAALSRMNDNFDNWSFVEESTGVRMSYSGGDASVIIHDGTTYATVTLRNVPATFDAYLTRGFMFASDLESIMYSVRMICEATTD